MYKYIILIATLAFGHAATHAQSTLTVDASTKAQTISGFGGSVAYFENWLAAHPNKADIYEIIFADLDLGILRIRNIHKNPASTITDTKDVVDGANTALGRNIEILLTSWSPPAALKAGGITNGGTLLKTNGQFVYAGWAQWWYDSIQFYIQSGIVPTYISMQNEPDYENTGWETCIFKNVESTTYPGYGVGLAMLHAKLQGMANRPKILGPEVTGVGYNNFQNYTNSLNRTLLDGYAYHLYNGGDSGNPDSFNANLAPIKATYSDKPNIMTEFSGGTWFNTAWLIHNCLTSANASGYLYWDLIWGRPYGTDGLVSLENPWERTTWTTPGGYIINPHYYALKHFSKHVSKGYARVGSTIANTNVRPTAFLSADGNKLVTVLLNVASSAQTVSLAINGFAASSATGVQSVENNYYYALPAVNPSGSVTLPARSVTTLEFARGQTIPVTGVAVAPTMVSVAIGGTASLAATVAPANATNKAVAWTSSAPAVATVSSTGVVTGVAAGWATITATTQSGGYTATSAVTVTAVNVPVTSVAVSPTAASIGVGATRELIATVLPANATNKAVTWTSSAPAIATVNASGVVTGVAAGTATITAKTVSGNFTAASAITVTGVNIPVTGVSVTPVTASISLGGTTTLTATVAPANATNKTVTWTSSAPAIATVSASGVVTGVTAGSATIRATTQSGGYTASSVVTVAGVTTPCANPVTITIPFVKDGVGEFCWVTSGTISYVNSWNMSRLEINGVDYTNRWSNSMPPRIDGKYYIRYIGAFPWSHFEANGSQ